MSRLPVGLHPRPPNPCNPAKGCHQPKTSLRFLNSRAPLTPFPVKPNACNKRTTCRTWDKCNPTCFRAWLRGCISNRTSLPAPTPSNHFKAACRSTSSLRTSSLPTNSRPINSHPNKAMSSQVDLKPPETTCRICNVARPSPAAPCPVQAMCPPWQRAEPKSPTIRPIHPRMRWSTGLQRPSAPSRTNAEANGFR